MTKRNGCEEHSRKPGLQVLSAAVLAAASSTALAHDYEVLEPEFPSPTGLFGGSIDVQGNTAVIGAASYGGVVYVMNRVNGLWEYEQKLVPDQPYNDAHFGNDVALFGEWLAIGAPGDDEAGNEAGAVYMYREYSPGRYSYHSKIFSSSPGAGLGSFGFALDADGITLCVGEPGANGVSTGSGRAELFQPLIDTWTSVQELHATPGTHQDFGWSVDMDGSRVAIGAPNWDDSNPGSGGVNVFDFDPTFGFWVRLHFLKSVDAEKLGRSVAVHGNELVAGAPETIWNGRESGALVTFAVTPFVAQQTGVFGGIEDDEKLGESVALGLGPDGELRAAGGAPFEDHSLADQGSVQMLQLVSGSNWVPVARLRSTAPADSAWLGTNVFVDGYECLAAAPLDLVANVRAGSVHSFDISSGSWIEGPTLVGSALDAGDYFGSDVAVHGDLAVVGSENDGEIVYAGGAVYVFERNGGGWRHVATLDSGSDTTRYGHFGARVDTDGERILVSARGENTATGAAYVFERDGSGRWFRTARLLANDGQANDFFGEAVDIDGDMALIGSMQADGNQVNSGAAYVYRRDAGGNWSQIQKLTPAGDQIGRAVALDTDAGELFIGAPGTSSVSRYTWNGSSWVAQLPIFPGAGENDRGFGRGIALHGEHLAIAASYLPGTSTIHLYRRVSGGWGFREAVVHSGEYYGSEIAYDGSRMAAGHQRGVDAFQRFDEIWQEDELEVQGVNFFGYPVNTAMSGAEVIIGNDRAGSFGHASIFTLDAPGPFVAYGFGDGNGSPCPCDNESAEGDDAGCLNTAGRGASLRGEGSASINADDMEMVAEGMPMNRIAQLFAGVRTTPGLPFGDGQRLVGAPIKRLGVRQADANGSARWSVDHGNFWAPGDTRYFQARYRDFGTGVCGTSFNTTSGLAVLFSD